MWRDQLQLSIAVDIAVSAVLPLQLLQTRQELWITNNLPAASVFTHVGQMPIGIDDQRGHGGNWRRLVDGDALLLQIHPVCVLSAHKPKAMNKPDSGGSRLGSVPL